MGFLFITAAVLVVAAYHLGHIKGAMRMETLKDAEEKRRAEQAAYLQTPGGEAYAVFSKGQDPAILRVRELVAARSKLETSQYDRDLATMLAKCK